VIFFSATMVGADFIADLPSFTRFSDVADPLHFAPVPDDWRLCCCDVVNSTQAIQQGRYKAVNMMGAACIMAAINAAGGRSSRMSSVATARPSWRPTPWLPPSIAR
jgi:hypothetical protein